MNMNLINEVTANQIKKDVPAFGAGDTVKVHVRIVEGSKERIQVFQGTVISRRGTGVSETFTVRKISSQVGVERTFPVHSPLIDHVEVVREAKPRRAKLYYLKGKTAKNSRIKEAR